MAEPQLNVCHLAKSATNPFPACGFLPRLDDEIVLPRSLDDPAANEITCPDCRAIMATRTDNPEASAAYLNSRARD